jgi:N-acetylmuramoyl-L-alanine amidase
MPGARTPGSTDRVDPVVVGAGVGPLRAPLRLDVDFAGFVRDPRVRLEIRPAIQHGTMARIDGIIVHQTGGSTAAGALEAYRAPGAHGAHFLIDKDGTIFQTASVYRVTHHVGHLKPRCRVEMRCTAVQAKALAGKRAGAGIGRVEAAKPWPERYPGNADALGIELVGAVRPVPGGGANAFEYEAVTAAQQQAFDWLLPRLLGHFGVRATEVYRHPQVSWKQPSEAASVRW